QESAELGIDCQLSDKLVLNGTSGSHQISYIEPYTTVRTVLEQIAGHKCCTALWLQVVDAPA
ncbi:hypothetical protein, partial [Zoogloea sp.]|uniref:hypothetical protein n=1 Tax=Zoogloea sp. TaxID=49181 RepID=UPI0035B16BF7